jgi:hypothetical protein
MIPVPKPIMPLPLKTTDINLWIDGVVTELDEGRLGVEALTSALNMVLDQDGTLRPRPSLSLYGPQPTGTVLGKPFEFSINNGLTVTFYMMCVQVVAGVANVYIAKPEDTVWVKVTAATTFSTTALCTFIQLASKVIILNGVNPITYLDLTTVPGAPALTRFVSLANPVNTPTLTPTGLTGTTFNVWYAATYNSTVGQTLAGPTVTQAVSTQRELWAPATQNVAVNIGSIPAGVQSWNLYCATTQNGSSTPTLFLIASGLPVNNTTFVDNGTAPQILNTVPPLFNSTAGPLASRGAAIGGRLFLLGDSNNPYALAIGGDFGFELDFSPANGGDSLPIGQGSGNLPTVVWNFRSGQGDPEIKVMTQDPGGTGKRYSIAQSTVNYSGNEIEVWTAQEDYGFNGTSAPGSLIGYNNNTYYLASDSFYTTGTEPQLQNLLNTKSVAQTLSSQNDIGSINQNALNLVDGSAWQQKLFFCLPIESMSNNQVWTLDLQRGGAWMKPWNIACQGIVVIQDNSANTHQLFLVGNQIFESTYNLLTNDNGAPFPTGAATGVIGFSADQRTWAQVLKIIVVLLRAQGTINFTVLGWTLNNKLETVGQATYVSAPNSLGYGWNQGGYNLSPMLRWNDFFSIPKAQVPLSVDVPIVINQQLRYFLVQISTQNGGTDFNVSQLIPLFVVVGVKNLT